jgi:hypothetical protein
MGDPKWLKQKARCLKKSFRIDETQWVLPRSFSTTSPFPKDVVATDVP